MKNKIKKQLLSLAIVFAMVLSLAACGDKAETVVTDETPVVTDAASEVEEVEEVIEEETTADVADDAAEETEGEDATVVETVDATEVGEGETQFTFEVVDGEGNATYFLVNTDKTTVGEALVELELIAGDESDYGLYVKTVNGITADYDVDQTYWAFYVDGEYAMTGVDSTDVVAGSTYSFKVEK